MAVPGCCDLLEVNWVWVCAPNVTLWSVCVCVNWIYEQYMSSAETCVSYKRILWHQYTSTKWKRGFTQFIWEALSLTIHVTFPNGQLSPYLSSTAPPLGWHFCIFVITIIVGLQFMNIFPHKLIILNWSINCFVRKMVEKESDILK